MGFRSDSVGMFWQDQMSKGRGGSNLVRQKPPINSDWEAPRDFPSLKGAKRIAIDCETRDEDLLTLGPGVRRGAYIAGLAVGTGGVLAGMGRLRVARSRGPRLRLAMRPMA